ncbi:unnamed protein product [Calicophoron daubneyi]|uniref:SAC domain-containing protein n=1 Tax=Calicophoron daubneyi TaxID=300641 RepID=A0AAV2T048_CALDB
MECTEINWIRAISVYETPSHIYLVGSDLSEQRFRVLKIGRSPLPPDEDGGSFQQCNRNAYLPTIECETPFDRVWRLDMVEDPYTYTKSEMARLLHTIQAASRLAAQSSYDTQSLDSKISSGSAGGNWLRNVFKKRHVPFSPSGSKPILKDPTSVGPLTEHLPQNAKELQQAAASALGSGMSERSLVLSAKCNAIAGVVRFLRGYYLILITKAGLVAEIGEHKIFKVEGTTMIYIPGNEIYETSQACGSDNGSKLLQDEVISLSSSSTSEDWQRSSSSTYTQAERNRAPADEMRYVKLFSSVDLASNFYFSHTYDLSRSLQYNMEPISHSVSDTVERSWTLGILPNDRFIWNWRLIPLMFRSDFQWRSGTETPTFLPKPNWFVYLFHGSIDQISLTACGMPIMVTLIGRRSRHFAGTRFLKRGINLTGDAANEVETEQIVHDTSHAFLDKTRCSSYVQMRGSVPVFWSQEPSKVVVRRPPIEISREDPYFEASGLHFVNLFERYGSPIVILNLMKTREKHPFELVISEAYERGVVYLSQFLPSRISSNTTTNDIASSESVNPPIIYISFDIARVQKSKELGALDELRPIIDFCVRRTGIYLHSGLSDTSKHQTDIGISSRQCGVIRVNCVDCLDRTNSAQFVVGRVALAYQLYYLGFIAEPYVEPESKIDRLFQNLYDDHGDILALQYAGSQLVHNIATYKKTHSLSSHSRDLVQTLSRFYSNKFSDWDKQCAINVFLRIYRPVSWSGTLLQWMCEMLKRLIIKRSQASTGSSDEQLRFPDTSACNNPDAVFAAVTGSFGAPIWDLPSDTYLHWLDSWCRLSVRRNPLTDWCPLKLLKTLPYGMDITNKAALLSKKFPPERSVFPRVPDLSEQNQTFYYQSLKEITLTPSRGVELLVQIPAVNALVGFVMPTESGEKALPLSRAGRRPPTRPSSGQKIIPITTVELYQSFAARHTAAVPSANSPPDPDKRGNKSEPKNTWAHKLVRKSNKALLGFSLEDQTPAKKGSSHRKKHDVDDMYGTDPNDQECEYDESSSESDSAEPTESFVRLFPTSLLPALVNAIQPNCQQNESDIISGPSHSASGIDYHPISLSPPQIGADQRDRDSPEDLWSWVRVPTLYDSAAFSRIVKEVNTSTYQQYIDFRLSSNVGFPKDVSSTPLKCISPEDMSVYKRCVKIAIEGPQAVSSSSMAVYQATANAGVKLRC